ncbi:MAG: phosphoribosyl-ATP diphosphatase, partial [Rhodoferax sp.]|nr:phosphoribosyl-ATP diphosphatase [Rhodoferax sp.]
VIQSRKLSAGGDPATSYVARLLQHGPDSFLKKIGEEATEVVMAAKDLSHALATAPAAPERRAALVGEVADLWFHCMVALAHFGIHPSEVVTELERREGSSGIEKKALRKALARESGAIK